MIDLTYARERLGALAADKAKASSKKAEFDAIKAAIEEAQLRVEKLQKLLQIGVSQAPPPGGSH